jgi:vacuolar-type H+-ATPase subunit D/Vma8
MQEEKLMELRNSMYEAQIDALKNEYNMLINKRNALMNEINALTNENSELRQGLIDAGLDTDNYLLPK